MKKINGDMALDHYTEYNSMTGEIQSHKKPEYTTMSRRPGIGSQWFDKFSTDIYPSDACIVNGKKVKPPKFYDTLYEKQHPISFEKIKQIRETNAYANRHEQTDKRRLVKQKICDIRIKQLQRKLHI